MSFDIINNNKHVRNKLLSIALLQNKSQKHSHVIMLFPQ